jgi:hypothetical protein
VRDQLGIPNGAAVDAVSDKTVRAVWLALDRDGTGFISAGAIGPSFFSRLLRFTGLHAASRLFASVCERTPCSEVRILMAPSPCPQVIFALSCARARRKLVWSPKRREQPSR